ncbi:MAG: MBL fold metallo-hydrolase [Gemmatimonadetes bacterium]|nr:MBL fold metallo-hydrolase [Gemmatimonadota bacterium]
MEAAPAVHAHRTPAARQLNARHRGLGLAGTSLPGAALTSLAVAVGFGPLDAQIQLDTQSPLGPVESHVAAAVAAAGNEHLPLLLRICTQAAPSARGLLEGMVSDVPDGLTPLGGGMPEWYAAPVKVFDNLYYVGQTEYSAWAVTTSEGIIIIDPIFDYSVEAEVTQGLQKLGLNPADIRYVVVSHGHSDHAGGARYLQDEFRARVIVSAPDWELLETTGGDWPKPRRDIEATDGYELRLGDTTLELVATPGHTPGTISTFIPVTDNGTPHTAVLVGGTAFNFMGRGDDARWFREYIASAERLRLLASQRGADVILSNHTRYDGSTVKLPALARRRPGEAHPYVVGPESIWRYLTVAAECARAGLGDN